MSRCFGTARPARRCCPPRRSRPHGFETRARFFSRYGDGTALLGDGVLEVRVKSREVEVGVAAAGRREYSAAMVRDGVLVGALVQLRLCDEVVVDRPQRLWSGGVRG